MSFDDMTTITTTTTANRKRRTRMTSSGTPSSSFSSLQRICMIIVIMIITFITQHMSKVLVVGASSSSSTSFKTVPLVMDGNGGTNDDIRFPSAIPSSLAFQDKGIVTIIKSPNTPLSPLLSSSDSNNNNDDHDDNLLLSMMLDNDHSDRNLLRLICRGAILKGTTSMERSALYLCSLLSHSLVITGITENDYHPTSSASSAINAFRNSRHARTLTALFRSKLLFSSNNPNDNDNTDNQQEEKVVVVATTLPSSPKKQALVLLLDHAIDDDVTSLLQQEVYDIYQAVALERKATDTPFDQLYDLSITTTTEEALDIANKHATDVVSNTDQSTSSSSLMASMVFASTWSIVHDYNVSGLKSSLSNGLDTSLSASLFVIVMDSYSKYSQMIQNKILLWKKRIARGLYIEQYQNETKQLISKCLYNGYDMDTLNAVGLPQVSKYRLVLRKQLVNLLETSIVDLYQKQVNNIQAMYTKRLQNDLLKTMVQYYKNGEGTTSYESNEAYMNANTALLRQQSFAVETILDNIQVPLLGLTKDKTIRLITSALNDIVINFPDSNIAKLQRTKLMNKDVNNDKKLKKGKKKKISGALPAIGVGLDLVAMIRPDGFGSLQGFAGYALPGGNSITVGVHNDADDPQVIAGFGGIRPPFLRIQPKLRVDVEL